MGGTFQDEMGCIYLSLVRLNVPMGVEVLAEPGCLRLSQRAAPNGGIMINQRIDNGILVLFAETDDFKGIKRPITGRPVVYHFQRQSPGWKG